MKSETVIILSISIVMLVVIIFLNLKILQDSGDYMQVNFDKCCNGQPCTDTYWDAKQDKCIYTMDNPLSGYNFSWWTILIIILFSLVLIIIVRINSDDWRNK